MSPCDSCSCSLGDPQIPYACSPQTRLVSIPYLPTCSNAETRKSPSPKTLHVRQLSSSFPNILNFFFSMTSVPTLLLGLITPRNTNPPAIILLQTSFWCSHFSVHLAQMVPQVYQGLRAVNELAFCLPLPIHLFFPSAPNFCSSFVPYYIRTP